MCPFLLFLLYLDTELYVARGDGTGGKVCLGSRMTVEYLLNRVSVDLR